MIALSTGSLYTYGLDRVFALASKAGFDGIELMIDHRWDTRHTHYLCELMDRYSLAIVAMHSPFVASVPGWPDDEPGRIKQTAQLAEEVGARVVVAHLPRRFDRLILHGSRRRLRVPVPWPRHNDYRHWLLNDLADFRSSTRVTIAIENMPAWCVLGRRVNLCHWNDVESIQRFSELTMDTTHLGTWEVDPIAAYEAWGERVAHVHLSNYNGAEHRLLEDGSLRLGLLLQRLAAGGYEGIVALEFNPHSLQADSEQQVRDNLQKSLAFCRTHFARQTLGDCVPAHQLPPERH